MVLMMESGMMMMCSVRDWVYLVLMSDLHCFHMDPI
jgi:hypothetical protein